MQKWVWLMGLTELSPLCASYGFYLVSFLFGSSIPTCTCFHFAYCGSICVILPTQYVIAENTTKKVSLGS